MMTSKASNLLERNSWLYLTKKLLIMADISVLILVLNFLEEHFHQIICLYPPVIQPFRRFWNCQFFPIVKSWIEENFNKREVISLALDRSQWQGINLLMVSLIYDNRGIPIYFRLLPQKGNSNLAEQKKVLSPVLKLLKDFQV